MYLNPRDIALRRIEMVTMITESNANLSRAKRKIYALQTKANEIQRNCAPPVFKLRAMVDEISECPVNPVKDSRLTDDLNNLIKRVSA